MAHECQIPNPGDFFLTYIGEDRVIVVRDKDGGLQVLLNTCRHRGNAVCRAEEGHATSFMCTYHGWTYDLKGDLVGVPGFKDYYHEDLNREEWGLVTRRPGRQLQGLRLRDARPGGAVARRLPRRRRPHRHRPHLPRAATIAVVGGIQKYTIGCNWKLAADNVWDFYHAAISHASSFMAGWRRDRHADKPRATAAPASSDRRPTTSSCSASTATPSAAPRPDEQRARQPQRRRHRLTPGATRPSARRKSSAPSASKRASHPNIFPNIWITETRARSACACRRAR